MWLLQMTSRPHSACPYLPVLQRLSMHALPSSTGLGLWPRGLCFGSAGEASWCLPWHAVLVCTVLQWWVQHSLRPQLQVVRIAMRKTTISKTWCGNHLTSSMSVEGAGGKACLSVWWKAANFCILKRNKVVFHEWPKLKIDKYCGIFQLKSIYFNRSLEGGKFTFSF